MNLKQYADYATESQTSVLKAVDTEGSTKAAAKKLGVTQRAVQRTIKRVKEKAALQGFDPEAGMDNRCPKGYKVSSVKLNSEGNYVPFYAKPDENSEDILEDIIEALNSKIKPVKAVDKPKKLDDKLLNLYTLSDVHLGQLSWGPETGADYDLNIAVDLVKKSFSDMIQRSPKADICFINLLGDFLHIDSMIPATPASGHILDADTRYPKLLDAAIDLIKWLIQTALKTHGTVNILSAEGNHDPATSMAFSVFLKHLYEKEPRVRVVDSPRPYYSYVFGQNMLCFHHGHKRNKVNDLTRIFSFDPEFRPDFGRTKYSYGHFGHLHHIREEDSGMLWTQHPTLAGKDAYASRGGWSSQRACIAFTYHEDFGEYSSIVVRPEMFGEV